MSVLFSLTDYPQPEVPPAILSYELPEDFNEVCQKLWEDIIHELLDAKYYWRAHYKRHTFNLGCRGPLCSKYVRDSSRSRPRSARMYAPRDTYIYDPVIDYYRIVADLQVKDYQYQLQQDKQTAL